MKSVLGRQLLGHFGCCGAASAFMADVLRRTLSCGLLSCWLYRQTLCMLGSPALLLLQLQGLNAGKPCLQC
jgi:hypothetical protein